MSALKNIESWIERTLTTVIDFFYPPFRKVMSLELFRYAACGGLNLVLEWVLYYVFYHFVFNYFGLKLFVEVLHIWPTVSYIIISILCVTFSYLTNKFYSFRKEKKS